MFAFYSRNWRFESHYLSWAYLIDLNSGQNIHHHCISHLDFLVPGPSIGYPGHRCRPTCWSGPVVYSWTPIFDHPVHRLKLSFDGWLTWCELFSVGRQLPLGIVYSQILGLSLGSHFLETCRWITFSSWASFGVFRSYQTSALCARNTTLRASPTSSLGKSWVCTLAWSEVSYYQHWFPFIFSNFSFDWLVWCGLVGSR